MGAGITSSPAFKQDGLLIIAFDESVGDATACCGELPGPYDRANGILPGGSGPGGGVVGAVLISPFIAPGTKSTTSYNHYSMLGSVEDLFGLPRLADARGTTGFGGDIYTRPAPQDSGLSLSPASFTPRSKSRSRKHQGATISYRDSEPALTRLTIQRLLSGYRVARQICRPLMAGRQRPKHSQSCSVTQTVGTLAHRDTAGANRLAFTGRLNGRPLAKGSYVLKAAPTLGAQTGSTRTARFKVI